MPGPSLSSTRPFAFEFTLRRETLAEIIDRTRGAGGSILSEEDRSAPPDLIRLQVRVTDDDPEPQIRVLTATPFGSSWEVPCNNRRNGGLRLLGQLLSSDFVVTVLLRRLAEHIAHGHNTAPPVTVFGQRLPRTVDDAGFAVIIDLGEV